MKTEKRGVINVKRKLGDVWQEGRFWKVQFPQGLITFNTKGMAEKVVKEFQLKEEYHYVSFNLPNEGKERDGYFCKEAYDVITEIYGIKIRALCGSFSIKTILELKEETNNRIKVYNDLPDWAKSYESNKENYKRVNNL